jgi:Sigma-70 region 2
MIFFCWDRARARPALGGAYRSCSFGCEVSAQFHRDYVFRGPVPRQNWSAFEINNIQRGRVTCCMYEIQPPRSFGEGVCPGKVDMFSRMSSRQGCGSSGVRVLTPSITCIRRLAYSVRAEATKHVQPECKSLGSLRSFQGRSSFSTWLTRIVINSALMTLRRKSGHPEASLDEILHTQPEWFGR